MIFSDYRLAQKIERTESRANAAMVTARARLFPQSGAAKYETAGVYAMFDGTDSPLTQTFGLGLFEAVTPTVLTALEDFFISRQSPVFHEVSPLADAAVTALLNARGYRPMEYTNIMIRELSAQTVTDAPAASAPLLTRTVDATEAAVWAGVSAAGWATEMPEMIGLFADLGRISAHASGGVPFLAELAGRPVSAAMLFMYDDVALLAGASTVPEARRQGAQNALLAARLRHAAAQGCTFAMMGAQPGSQSQRNAEKNGFRVAYTRIKWELPEAAERIEKA